MSLIVNLRNLQEIPGLNLTILINSADNKNLLSKPLPTKMEEGQIFWQLKLGEVNTIEFQQWRWNQIGLGSILILFVLLLTLALQKVRLAMGFGFPELPP